MTKERSLHVRTTSKQFIALLVIAIASLSLFTGCGGGGSDRFALCGNARIDPGEACDDGNLSDSDDCLSTCQLATCGDTFVDSFGSRHEDCDVYHLGTVCAGAPSIACDSDSACPTPRSGECQTASCLVLGFPGGTLGCSAACAYDTSGCTPIATATSTPTVTPTPKESVTPTPTIPTPTPAICTSVTVTVSLVYDANAVPDLAGLVVDLNYPVASVDLPGSGSDDSVIERVTDVSGAAGFSSIQDLDTNNDDTDDQLHNVYAATQNIPPGPFEAVVFDCRPGAQAPPAGAFVCTVSDTVDSQANPVEGVGCKVEAGTQ
jgi:cysteine-rich repeat protein